MLTTDFKINLKKYMYNTYIRFKQTYANVYVYI